jgi:hypothetical protein
MFWRRERERDLEREIRGDLELEAAERPSSGCPRKTRNSLPAANLEFTQRRILFSSLLWMAVSWLVFRHLEKEHPEGWFD